MKLRRALAATTLLASGGAIALAAPANADLVTRCVGEGGAVTVPGDLVVPAGKTCWLDGTTVEGNVRVQAGADLIVTGGTLKGTVVVNENAYVDATDTTITGTIRTANAFGAYLDNSEVGGAVNASTDAESPYDGFVYVVGSEIAGKVEARVPGEVLLDGARVGGAVVTDGTRYTDIYDSTLDKALTVTNNPDGAVFCESEVYGSASYSGNSYVLQLGANGPITSCEGASYWDKNLDVSNNTATIVVSNNVIRGNLSGEGNDPAPTGENNRVRGTVSGQFVDLPAPAALRASAAQDRAAELAAKAAERRSDAQAEADAAGDAKL
jgi:hypothetical protein